jgi:hypothetical protein
MLVWPAREQVGADGKARVRGGNRRSRRTFRSMTSVDQRSMRQSLNWRKKSGDISHARARPPARHPLSSKGIPRGAT